MYVKLGSITVYISFSFAVFLAVAANIAGGRNLLLSFLFSFIHEAVHLIFLRFSGIKKAEVRLFPAGIKICCEGMNMLSYRKTVLTALSAPVFNLIAGAVFLFLHKSCENELLYVCCAVNFILGAINLLPLSFLDGGRTLYAMLSERLTDSRVRKIMSVLNIWVISFLFLLFFAGFVMGKTAFFLLFFCVYCLVGTLSK